MGAWCLFIIVKGAQRCGGGAGESGREIGVLETGSVKVTTVGWDKWNTVAVVSMQWEESEVNT